MHACRIATRAPTNTTSQERTKRRETAQYFQTHCQLSIVVFDRQNKLKPLWRAHGTENRIAVHWNRAARERISPEEAESIRNGRDFWQRKPHSNRPAQQKKRSHLAIAMAVCTVRLTNDTHHTENCALSAQVESTQFWHRNGRRAKISIDVNRS